MKFSFPTSFNLNESINHIDIVSESDIDCQIIRMNPNNNSVIQMFQSETDQNTVVYGCTNSEYTQMERLGGGDDRSDAGSIMTTFKIHRIHQQNSSSTGPVTPRLDSHFNRLTGVTPELNNNKIDLMERNISLRDAIENAEKLLKIK